MARQHGQATWVTPSSNAALGDDASSTSTRRIFTATERMTVVEVGAVVGDSAHVPNTSFAFTASKRQCGVAANDMVIPVFTAAFAAEGGPGGDPSVLNFDNANQIPNGIITNTLGTATGFGASSKCVLRAFCEVSLDKGDQLVIAVTTGGGASSTAIFYATAFYDGKGLVEPQDADSN
jgi:hypothetical protein